VSFGHAVSYLPILDLVRDLLGLKGADSVETILGKVDHGIRDQGEEVAWTAPFIRALLSLDPGDPEVALMIPAQRRGRTAEGIRAVLVQASRHRRMVLVIEDLHWIDPHSEEVVRVLLEGIAAAPLAVILSYRPGYAPP
jgi:predicted ATPase